jgi:phage terminase large subunit-like protein
MKLAGAARTDAILLGITTPGYDVTSLAHNLYQSVKAGNTSLYGRIYESDPAADIDDRDNWKRANPCYNVTGFAESMESDRELLPEHEFRRFRLGQWTATESAWLQYGKWASLALPQGLPPAGTKVFCGFDGSYSGDASALMGCTDEGYLFVIGCWENPNPGRKGWRVPRDDVMATVAGAFDHWDVQELVCDPPYWAAEIAQWSSMWGDHRVIEFPTYSRARMAPATTAFYAAVMDGNLTHDGDTRLARHVSNCVVKQTPQGDVVTKANKDSPAKIDLAIAAILAHSRASVNVAKKRSPLVVL